MKKVMKITTSIQKDESFMSSAVVQIINGEIKDFNVPEMDTYLIHVSGKTEKEAKQNLKNLLDLERIDYKNFKL